MAEADERRERFGENRIQEVRAARWYQVLARQFTDVLILILFAAAVISFAVGEVADAITILVIVVLNGALGFVQEWRAEQALDALRSMLSPTCTVVRDGATFEIDSVHLVPGDLVATYQEHDLAEVSRFIADADERFRECRRGCV